MDPGQRETDLRVIGVHLGRDHRATGVDLEMEIGRPSDDHANLLPASSPRTGPLQVSKLPKNPYLMLKQLNLPSH